MKRYLMPTLVALALGTSLMCSGQIISKEHNSIESSISIRRMQFENKRLRISLDIDEKWVLFSGVNSETLELKHCENKAKIEIKAMRIEEAYDSIFVSKKKSEVNEMIRLLQRSASNKNISQNTSFSRTVSETKNGNQICITYKTIDKQAFQIIATFDPTCIECKKDIELMIESMSSL